MKAAKPASQIKRFVRLFGGHAPKNTQVFFFRHTLRAIRIAETNSSYDVKVDNQVITSGDSMYRKTVSYTLYDVGVPYTRPMTPEEKIASERRSFIANSNAVIWLQSEATNGSVSAQCSLGLHYLNGQGCETNKKLAVYWLTQAANQGDFEASNTLAKLK